MLDYKLLRGKYCATQKEEHVYRQIRTQITGPKIGDNYTVNQECGHVVEWNVVMWNVVLWNVHDLVCSIFRKH